MCPSYPKLAQQKRLDPPKESKLEFQKVRPFPPPPRKTKFYVGAFSHFCFAILALFCLTGKSTHLFLWCLTPFNLFSGIVDFGGFNCCLLPNLTNLISSSSLGCFVGIRIFC